MDFGLSDDYWVLDSLDQDKIFYDPLLCKIKRQKSICNYQINTKFVAKLGKVNNMGGMTSFLAAGAFVNNTIWIGNSQAVTQFILDIVSEFFMINDISINNDKIVAISINQRVQNTVLRISGLLISIVRHSVPYRYLGIFLLTDSLSKPNLAKAQSDVKVFFQYDALVRKGFKLKAAEEKSAFVVSFSNSSGVVGQFFEHYFLDLQVLGWVFLNPLQYPIRLHVGVSNNFLARIMCILLANNNSVVNNLPSAFLNSGKYSVSCVLGSFLYYDWVSFLRKFGVAFCDRLLDKCSKYWKRLNSRGSVPSWFILVSRFLYDKILLPTLSNNNSLFFVVKNGLLKIWSSFISVFTDGSLKRFGSVDVTGGAVAFFPEIGLGIRVGVVSLLSSIMAELQTVVLVLKCISFSCSVKMCLDSQAALDACVSELRLGGPDFCNYCWIERRHIVNLIIQKDISVSWLKVKEHFSVPDNVCMDALVCTSAYFSLLLPTNMHEHFFMTNSMQISGNIHYFILNGFLVCDIDWIKTMTVWHPDSGMLSSFTDRNLAGLHFYFMKTMYDRLSVAVRKRLYDKNYPGVLCLHCGEVEFSDHVFIFVESFLSCVSNVSLYALLCKDFVLVGWFEEAMWIFENRKVAA
ncbi:hypothetical protein G9A89_006172 [Geosiphon pyriformis]|nr:hypothetical protein G9A89_006172 [Geosiphon pyriformis]